jgi:hypothetical protein
MVDIIAIAQYAAKDHEHADDEEKHISTGQNYHLWVSVRVIPGPKSGSNSSTRNTPTGSVTIKVTYFNQFLGLSFKKRRIRSNARRIFSVELA